MVFKSRECFEGRTVASLHVYLWDMRRYTPTERYLYFGAQRWLRILCTRCSPAFLCHIRSAFLKMSTRQLDSCLFHGRCIICMNGRGDQHGMHQSTDSVQRSLKSLKRLFGPQKSNLYRKRIYWYCMDQWLSILVIWFQCVRLVLRCTRRALKSRSEGGFCKMCCAVVRCHKERMFLIQAWSFCAKTAGAVPDTYMGY